MEVGFIRCNEVEIRSQWIKMGPKPKDFRLYERKERDLDPGTEETPTGKKAIQRQRQGSA